MGQSLAVKYRPQSFNQLVEQESIKIILNKQLELNKISHAYIFAGASGCGKTTTARIFAKAINKGIGDAIEIDGASNNGVDNVREIVASASERSLSSTYKIFIIDEAHMLTIQAWNALLKCIEETPEYTIFIFCTTDPQKIPATIQNRCMQFNFNKISADKIRERLGEICSQEGFTNYKEACDYISKSCNNQLRDAISLLEKCADYSTDLALSNVQKVLGDTSYQLMFNLINAVIDTDLNRTFETLNQINQTGVDPKVFVEQFLRFCLDINKYALFKAYNEEVIKIPRVMEKDLKNATNFENAERYYSYVVDKILNLKNMLKNDSNPFNTVEVVFSQLCRLQ